MRSLRNFLRSNRPSASTVESNRVATPTIDLDGHTLVQQALGYVEAHADLEPLLAELAPVADSRAARSFFKDLNVEEPVEHDSPYSVFRSLVSLTATAGETSLQAWAVTAESLGDGPNVLTVLIEGDSAMLPYTLLCCRLASGKYLARYTGEDVVGALALST